MPNRPAATVLIVEDSASDRESFKRHLQRNNEYAFRFVEASCGEEGLAAYRQLKPDCVLLDYSLPDTDGLQFLSSIQATSPARKVPVVMLTGQGTSSVAVEAIRSGAVDYLVKSKLNADSLNAAVTSAIGTRADRAEPPKPCYHVLIIDDSATDAERYRRLLKDTGRERFEFSEAQTGADGLEAFDRHRPDCVLLDYNLPDFDGLEFLQTLAEEQGRKSQPMPVIVMLTGQGSEAVAVEA
ncbi:MAG TPA: response regulator, partial [Solimonas sp.]|nr:response regulator [Solimonas sp.]